MLNFNYMKVGWSVTYASYTTDIEELLISLAKQKKFLTGDDPQKVLRTVRQKLEQKHGICFPKGFLVAMFFQDSNGEGRPIAEVTEDHFKKL